MTEVKYNPKGDIAQKGISGSSTDSLILIAIGIAVVIVSVYTALYTEGDCVNKCNKTQDIRKEK